MKATVRPAYRHLAAGALLLVVGSIVYAPLLELGFAPYSAYSDLIAQHLATKQVGFAAGSGSGELPLWRDDQLLGAPALTNPQALYLHPLQLAFWFLSPLAAMGPTLVLQFFVAALGCYVLSLTLGASRFAALLAGLAGLVAWKPILAAHAGWLAPLATCALVPWLLASLIHVAERPGAASALGLALASAFAFAGGSPQLLYYAALLGVPYLLLSRRADGDRAALGLIARRMLVAASSLALGLACNAYLWGSVLADWPWLSRSHDVGDYDFFLSGHGLGLAQLGSLLSPQIGSSAREAWEDSAYFGLVPLALAVFGAAASTPQASPATRRTRYFAFALLASVALSLDTPLLRAVHALVPGYASFRLPGRMLFVTTYLGVALAGPGLDRLLALLRARGATRAAVGCGITLMFAITIEGVYLARTQLATRPQAELLPAPDHPARLIAARAAPGARTVVAGRHTLSYGWAQALGLSLVNGYDPYNFRHYKRYMALATDGQAIDMPGNWVDVQQIRRSDLLDELAARFVIAPEPIASPRLTLLGSSPRVSNFVLYRGLIDTPQYVYETTTARPYARFASGFERLPSEESVLQRMASERLRGQAFVLDPTGVLPLAAASIPAPAPDPGSQLRLLSREPGHLRLQADCASAQLLVVSELFHPGWQATIDGRAATPLQVNLAIVGIWLEAGQHELTLRYAPLHFARDCAVSALAWLAVFGLSGWVVATRVRARRAPRPRA